MSCGGGFLTPGGTYDSGWDIVKPVIGNYFFDYFQYQEFVGCFCMLNYWFSSYVVICAYNYNFPVQVEGLGSQFEVRGVSVRRHDHQQHSRYLPRQLQLFRFTLMDKCRSEKWEVCLYGEMPVVLRQGMESSRAATSEVSAVAARDMV